jgi:hypothetical protein
MLLLFEEGLEIHTDIDSDGYFLTNEFKKNV